MLPAARATDPKRIGQHGLEIVTALTTEATLHGKRLTATVDLARAASPG
ncbi:hypothetical protein [Streptomyces rhizosphaerihabitans]|nr:hypothetical protein [Streptomyces rhizosphaerihabitans]MCT9011420.1 hypothetical protein [Streptomyces rhizosphaerihabitans]